MDVTAQPWREHVFRCFYVGTASQCLATSPRPLARLPNRTISVPCWWCDDLAVCFVAVLRVQSSALCGGPMTSWRRFPTQ